MYKCKCCGKTNMLLKGSTRMVIGNVNYKTGNYKTDFICNWCGAKNIVMNGEVKFVN